MKHAKPVTRSQAQAQPVSRPSAKTSKPQASTSGAGAGSGLAGVGIFEEMDQALIAQILEEDENRMLAEKLQNEMYGGASAGVGGGQAAGVGGGAGAGAGFDYNDGVRRADRQRV